MLKAFFHPKAFLSAKKNVKPGLAARTQVIQALENVPLNARGICKVTELSYRIVVHHLRLLEAEKVVTRRGNKPFIWALTGVGQQRLVNLKSR